MAIGDTFIFCEGKPDSFDAALLHETILTASGPKIVPLGEKKGFNAGIDGYFARQAFPGATESDTNQADLPRFIAIRDRDFDIKPSTSPELLRLRGKKEIWATYRASIENYVIEASLLESGWRPSGAEKILGKFPGIAKTTAILEESARAIADYQSIRWALADLKPGERWPEIGSTWRPDGIGDLPQELDFQSCLDEARVMTETYVTQANTVSVGKLETLAEQFRTQFSQPEFYEQQQYLVWFHGKDLLKMVCRKLGDNFPCKKYTLWAVANLNLESHPDLLQLQTLCNNLGS